MAQQTITFHIPGFPGCEINIVDNCTTLFQILTTHPPLCLPCPNGSEIWEKFRYYLKSEDREISLHEHLQNGWIIEARPAK